MKLVEHSIKTFIKEIDSVKPAPGGGSASALSVAIGISLVRMVAHLSMGKKKFKDLTDKEKNAYTKRFRSLNTIKNKVLVLVDQDRNAFNMIMEAFKLPKANDAEIKKRNAAIYDATIEATRIPYQVVVHANQAIEMASTMLEHANQTALSDFGVGLLMIQSGMEGALLNVKTNMLNFANKGVSGEYINSSTKLFQESKLLVAKSMREVNKVLK